MLNKKRYWFIKYYKTKNVSLLRLNKIILRFIKP